MYFVKSSGVSQSKVRDVLCHRERVNKPCQYIPRRWIVFLGQSDYFLSLGISCTIQLRAKQDGFQFCFCCGRRTSFSINEGAIPDNTKKATKFGKKVFIDLYIFYFIAINEHGMNSKCFVFKWWVGNKPTKFGKIALKIKKK